jgi:hypothetical protein
MMMRRRGENAHRSSCHRVRVIAMTGAAAAYGGCVIQLARSLILPASTSCRSRPTFSHFCDRPVSEPTDSLSEVAANPRRHIIAASNDDIGTR